MARCGFQLGKVCTAQAGGCSRPAAGIALLQADDVVAAGEFGDSVEHQPLVAGRQHVRPAADSIVAVAARAGAGLVESRLDGETLHRALALPGIGAVLAVERGDVIAERMAQVEPELGVFECDESYFGGIRKGKRGRGAAGKMCVFGILERGGQVYALPVADAKAMTLLTALKTRVLADSVIYTDSWASYNILDVSGFKHHRVNHSLRFVGRRGNHQRRRELLEPVKARIASLQRNPTQALLLVLEGM